MFHVKRDPVQVPPALVRRTGHEVVDVGIDNLQRQCLGQLGRAEAAFAVDSNLEPGAAVTHPDLVRPRLVPHPAVKHEFLLAVTDQAGYGRTTKRLAPAQVGNRLEDAGLARPVRATNKVELRIGL